MSYRAESAVAIAKSYIGYHEGYNNSNLFSVWQGLDDNNPWCASFTAYCSYNAGYRFPLNSSFGVKGEAYTPTERLRALQEGLWHEKSWRAQPGDHVLFDWANNGLIDHVELVVYDDGNKIVTIGGNTSNGVYYRTRDRTYVAGFYALSQSIQAVLPPPPIKVRPMYEPAQQLRVRLQHPNGGWWDAQDNGLVDWLSPVPGHAPLPGGMTTDADKRKMIDENGNPRHVSRMEHRDYTHNGVTHHGYQLVFTDGTTAVPEAQHNT